MDKEHLIACHISNIELRPDSTESRLEFFIDGKPLMELLPEHELIDPTVFEEFQGKVLQEFIQLGRVSKASRLGKGSREWQVRAVDQLLLRAPPELADGRRRLYVCGGDCECEHIACVIQNRDGLFVWRDFARGYPVKGQSEVLDTEVWNRVDFVPNPHPKSSPITVGPFYFEEAAYKAAFEPLYARIEA
ncbi:MAG TPA: hypothetical protein VHI52_20445 [Verrucomicrobiae bacterium]|nr:hypothetical protein [Verrucomicrobiae bacterium]